MCFNPAITWGTAGLGFATCVLARVKNKSSQLYFPPFYFALMEVIQGLMYGELLHPSPLTVKILVYAAYLHVCFQPLVFNYWLGTFIAPENKAVYRFTLKLCVIGGLLLLGRIFFTGTAPLCSSYESLCSASPTIFFGNYHIAWSLPLKGAGWNYITPSIALHMFLFFMPGILLGLYRLMAVFFIFGPLLSAYITPDVSERPAIWCVIGLWLLAITILAALNRPLVFFLAKRQGLPDR